VTAVARRLQDQKVITYGRGIIKILDRKSLEALSCPCYRAFNAMYRTYLSKGRAVSPPAAAAKLTSATQSDQERDNEAGGRPNPAGEDGGEEHAPHDNPHRAYELGARRNLSNILIVQTPIVVHSDRRCIQPEESVDQNRAAAGLGQSVYETVLSGHCALATARVGRTYTRILWRVTARASVRWSTLLAPPPEAAILRPPASSAQERMDGAKIADQHSFSAGGSRRLGTAHGWSSRPALSSPIEPADAGKGWTASWLPIASGRTVSRH
jgi:hypothetical protein